MVEVQKAAQIVQRMDHPQKGHAAVLRVRRLGMQVDGHDLVRAVADGHVDGQVVEVAAVQIALAVDLPRGKHRKARRGRENPVAQHARAHLA